MSLVRPNSVMADNLDIPLLTNKFQNYIEDSAKFQQSPKNLGTLLTLLQLKGDILLTPTDRDGLNPFLIPLAKSSVDNSLICYIRWPTQKDDMDLQIVRTNEVGITLEAMGTDQLCKRIAVEQDFFSSSVAPEAVALVNAGGISYQIGEFMPTLKSGKFPIFTEEDRRLALDRYLLTKVGAFPDCYERIAQRYVQNKDEVSALVTCERAVSIFYGWGHPVSFQAKTLASLPNRDKEAKDSARFAMTAPKWTLAKSRQELDDLVKLAGFSDSSALGDLYAVRANDSRQKEIEEENLNPVQILLDQAAHLMDAVALGSVKGGWNEARPIIAKKYSDAGYSDIAKFIGG